MDDRADDMVSGAYRRCSDGALLLVSELEGNAQQRLRLTRRADNILFFEYDDGDCRIEFVAISERWGLPKAPKRDRRITAVLGPDNARRVTFSYGVWRRAVWFLLDALLVWAVHDKDERPTDQFDIKIVGGWRGNAWDPWVMTSMFYFSDSLRETVRTQPVPQPCRLDTPPLSALFRPGECETASLSPETATGLTRQEFTEALKRVPRFELSDGSVLFFSEVRPHIGPEYAPRSRYGFFDGTGLDFFSSTHISRSCTALSLVDDRFVSEPAIAELLFEKMFFASIAAHAICGEDPGAEATMVHPDFSDQTERFRAGQVALGQMPFSDLRASGRALRLNRRGFERVSGLPVGSRPKIAGFLRTILNSVLVRFGREH